MPLVAAKCTQCGANIEVDDTREAGICKYCGTAFITEKAINYYNNLITNNININSAGNTVNIVGTDDKSENYLRLARRAKQNEDVERAERFYNLVLEAQPDQWEANFYSTYFSVRKTKVCNILESALKFKNSLVLVIELIKENVAGDEVQKRLEEMRRDIFVLCSMLYRPCALDLQGQNYYTFPRINLTVLEIVSILYRFGDLIEEYFNDDACMAIAVESWKEALNLRKDFCLYCLYRSPDNFGDYTKKEIREEMERYIMKIQKFDPSYVFPKDRIPKDGACYIATCVYGSYDCPQVWTLRRFRDDTLDATWYGRIFIKCYYAISPTLVKLFGETKWFRTFWKNILDKIVSRLNRNGVKDTCYHDKI